MILSIVNNWVASQYLVCWSILGLLVNTSGVTAPIRPRSITARGLDSGCGRFLTKAITKQGCARSVGSVSQLFGILVRSVRFGLSGYPMG